MNYYLYSGLCHIRFCVYSMVFGWAVLLSLLPTHTYTHRIKEMKLNMDVRHWKMRSTVFSSVVWVIRRELRIGSNDKPTECFFVSWLSYESQSLPQLKIQYSKEKNSSPELLMPTSNVTRKSLPRDIPLTTKCFLYSNGMCLSFFHFFLYIPIFVFFFVYCDSGFVVVL